jgi:hypothetical protein
MVAMIGGVTIVSMPECRSTNIDRVPDWLGYAQIGSSQFGGASDTCVWRKMPVLVIFRQ